jgi:hypothetical protein
MANEFKRMQKLAGIITESQYNKSSVNEAISVSDAKEYADSWDDEDILTDFNETFSGKDQISKSDFVNFFKNHIDDMSEMKYIQSAWRKLSSGEGLYELSVNEGDTDYDRAKDAKRLGKKGEKNIYGAGVEKGEEIEKKKMKMSELKAAIKELALSEGEDDLNVNDDVNDYDPVYEDLSMLSMRDKDKIEQIIQMLNGVDGETMEYILRQVGMEDQMANQLVHNRAEMSEAKKDKEVEDIKDVDVTAGDEEVTADVTTTDVDPDVKAVQDALTQAQAAAEKLGDDKLTDQIGNTITFFTRSHVVEKPGMTAESNIKERISKLVKSL